jgi:uncharacterized protein YoaH (UPF0181 family)
VSAAEIIRELPQLTPADRQAVLEKLRELAAQEKLPSGHAMDLKTRGIDEAQAADLRARLKTFAEDWSCPEASIYDEEPAR